MIRPLLVTRAVLLFFEEIWLDDLRIKGFAVDNARRGNAIVFEVKDLAERGGESELSEGCSSAFLSAEESEGQISRLLCTPLSES